MLSVNSRGSIIEDKVNETLDVFLKAFEIGVKPGTVVPPKLKEYPSPLQEKVNLIKNHQLIRDAHTIIEGKLVPHIREMSFSPLLKTILEMNESLIEEITVQNEKISSDAMEIGGEDGNVISALEENPS